MNKIIYIFFATFFSINAVNAQVVTIPDDNFLTALRDEFVDLNNDGIIQISEAEKVTELRVSNYSIEDLTGIEAFKNLLVLDCSANQLGSLNITQNTALVQLDCSYNLLETLNLSANTSLMSLNCGTNLLTNLDLSKNKDLLGLYCYYNGLTVLDLSQNKKIDTLNCEHNAIANLNLSQNKALEYLTCTSNTLYTLDVSNNPALISIECYSNKINTLDLSNNLSLNFLLCQNNSLSLLNASKNTDIKSIICSSNPLLKVICVFEVDSVINNSLFKKDAGATWADTCVIATAVNEVTFDQTHQIYPNPTSGVIYMNDQALLTVVYNSMGKEMLNSEKQSLDLSTLETGMYLVKVLYATQKTYIYKITKE